MDASERRGRASEEAAAWWVCLQGEVSSAERAEFVDWLRESAIHVAEMMRVAQIHGTLEQFRYWADISTEGVDDDENIVALAAPGAPLRERDDIAQPPPDRSPPRTDSRAAELAAPNWRSRLALFRPAAVALACALLVVTTILLWPMVFGQTLRTERGERREVALADGSIVELDHETRLRVDFERDARRVVLERGRALFRVAKNPSRPFFVQADDITIRAVGTAFGVERRMQGIIVTVAEGRVAATVRSSVPRSSHAMAGEVFLTANQQITVRRSGSAEPVREVDSRRELAWAEGRLVFDQSSVAEVIEQFNRYNHVQLHVSDAALAKRPVSGIFSASDPESFIAFIQSVTSVRIVRVDEGNITLAPEVSPSPAEQAPNGER